MYVGPPYCRAEIYAGRDTCHTLVSPVEYAPRALLMLDKKDGTFRQTDGRQTVTLCFPPNAASEIITGANFTGRVPFPWPNQQC